MNNEISISKEKLIDYLIRICPDRQRGVFGDNQAYCQSLMNRECKALFINPNECPWDCPHLFSVSTKCTGKTCKRIKKLIKELKSNEQPPSTM